MKLIPVKYSNLSYPNEIKPRIQEVAGHFDILELSVQLPSYSLHTEYSYSERTMNSRWHSFMGKENKRSRKKGCSYG